MLFGYVPRSIHDAFLLSDVGVETYEANVARLRERVGERLQTGQDREKTRFDKKRSKPKSYEVGDVVLVRRERPHNDGSSRKLLPKYDGPFTITKILDHDRYVVEGMKGSNRSRHTYVGICPSEKLKFFRMGRSGSEDSESGNEATEGVTEQLDDPNGGGAQLRKGL